MTAGPILVTGLGCICAAGKNTADSLQAVYSGVRPQKLPDIFPEASLDVIANPVCAVREDWLGPNWREDSIRDSSMLLLKAAEEALASADLSAHITHGTRIGVCIGTTAGCALHFLEEYGKIRVNPHPEANYRAINSFYNHSMAFDLARALVQQENLRPGFTAGPLLTISNACTSGADAIAMAGEWIRQGLCDLAFAGGTDALSVIPYIGFNKLMIYSSSPCKPFDKQRSGLNLGEGAAVLVLESAAHAKKRQAAPLSYLKGWGAACDAHHLTAPHPQGRGLRMAVQTSLNMAGAQALDVSFINAHGTATPENDKIESLVYAQMFPQASLWASKGVTGHCLGGAGAVEAALTIAALDKGVIPASVGCDEPEENVAAMLTRHATNLNGRPTNALALSASLGFGGSNAALVFARPDSRNAQ
jgi:3-oxoacyl-[acyl-carrier-protein] synthase-1/3-oxoacyl-[acyl-carrier-protein] synthase II